jgi:hypothetical protein
MENIGFGIMCFGEEKYFRGTSEKVKKLEELGYRTYILTDDPNYFFSPFWGRKVEIIPYHRNYKSYYDKVSLVKNIHQNHDIAILLDADLHVIDYSLFEKLSKYDFKEGVSYIDTLLNHTAKFKTVGDIPMVDKEWLEYKKYINELYPENDQLETIWEYFIVFNKDGFDSDNFFNTYEKLQVVKEFCDVKLNKDVSGAGEGVSVSIASLINGIPLSKDLRLVTMTTNTLKPITRHTPSSEVPDYLK